MSDVAFTAPAHWRWLIVFYFFCGGIAAGSYVLAALLDLFGRPEDRPAARLGYLISLPALLLCPPLLILDLDRPERFWHLFLMSQRPGVMFKWWSPISIGSWALMGFGAFSLLSFLGALAEEERRPRWFPERLGALRRGVIGRLVPVGGAGFAFFIAGYTGVLISVTNRPLWSQTPLLGGLFIASATSASAALLGLLAARRGAAFAPTLPWISRMEHAAAVLELAVLALFLVWLGPAIAALRGPYGLLLGAAVLLGLMAPLAMAFLRARATTPAPAPSWRSALGAGLVLASSLAIRAAIVLASEAMGHA